MKKIPADIINHFVGIASGSALDVLRDERPDAKEHAQSGYLALFAPENAGGVTLTERFALGVFTLALHGAADMAAYYAKGLADSGVDDSFIAAVDEAARGNMATGPYGAYPKGPLNGENEPGPVYATTPKVESTLGSRLAAAFKHAHMLVYHPRDSKGAHLQALLDAGWTTEDIVTISQLITFLAYQLRLVHGLRAMARVGQ